MAGSNSKITLKVDDFLTATRSYCRCHKCDNYDRNGHCRLKEINLDASGRCRQIEISFYGEHNG